MSNLMGSRECNRGDQQRQGETPSELVAVSANAFRIVALTACRINNKLEWLNGPHLYPCTVIDWHLPPSVLPCSARVTL